MKRGEIKYPQTDQNWEETRYLSVIVVEEEVQVTYPRYLFSQIEIGRKKNLSDEYYIQSKIKSYLLFFLLHFRLETAKSTSK